VTETEHELEFVVNIRDFGTKTKVEQEVSTTLLLALHRAFGGGFVVSHHGTILEFDAKAYDGEHEGHDGPAVKETSAT
jgi:hypothetical protein